MMGHALLAAGLVLATTTPVRQAPTVSVMTWNACAGTNPACALYRGSTQELAWAVGSHAVGQQITPEVIFLQEFCTGATWDLENWLELATGRPWTVRSWGLTSGDGKPYACHPDQQGRARGAQSVTLAVADQGATFTTHPLASPPWSVNRAAICATMRAKRVNACGTHLSVGLLYDDKQPGAPYRTRQIRQLMALAKKPGMLPVFGGDLNVTPPGSAVGGAAGRRAAASLYRVYDECDGASGGRWTYRGAVDKKLDYLFTSKGRVLRCGVGRWSRASDHRPLYVEVAL